MGLIFIIALPTLVSFEQGLQGLFVLGGRGLSFRILLPVEQDRQRIDLCPERSGGQEAQQQIPPAAVQQDVTDISDDPRAEDLGDRPLHPSRRHLLVEVVELSPERVRKGREVVRGGTRLSQLSGRAHTPDVRRGTGPRRGAEHGLDLPGCGLRC
jgi:hypothetical protein